MKITSCPSCGSRKLKKVRRTLVEEYQGREYRVPGLEFHECPACGEKIYSPEAMRRIEAAYPAFRARPLPIQR
jgi:YgiT-type zinc finger domain-containing protein